MVTEEVKSAIKTLDIKKQIQIEATPDVVFDTILQPHGPLNEMKLKIEAFPGGRWFRDLGNNVGHLWGHVQVIKPPKILELVGPMMMSYPVASFVQYRLEEKAGGTLLHFTHQAIGLITPEHEKGLTEGWGKMMEAIRDAAQEK